ncbi:hypothetical protein DPSP01_013316 [Paraphaeosphaeria sporulosa]
MLPNGGVVREVMWGKNGIAPSLKPNTIIIDISSSSPLSTVPSAKTWKRSP